MGLCKCPKKRVTTQFCFEHRVNVCEHCMVTNHPKCVVQSYLRWLNDSDYKPICELCSKDLISEECVRLVCYHVFHWVCLDQFARQLQATTAPAGYTCPTCRVSLFPEQHLVSPVVDVLREKLSVVNWARAGLGLPLLSEDREQKPVSDSLKLVSGRTGSALPAPQTIAVNDNHKQTLGQRNTSERNDYNNSNRTTSPHSVVNMYENDVSYNYSGSSQLPRRAFDTVEDPKILSVDHDDNKYKRRSALEWFFRWWRISPHPSSQNRKSGGHLYRRYCMLGLLFIIGLTSVIIIFSWLGRMATAGDPSLDPLHNPNIRVRNTID